MILERRLRRGNLSTELSADRLDITGSSRCGCGGGSSVSCDLHGDDTAEWAGVRWVDDLDHADTRLSTSGTGAGGAGWDGDLDGVVLVDVGGTLDNAEVDESAGDETALLGGGDVTLGAWHLSLNLEGLALGEGTGAGGVEDGRVWSSSVSGDDVNCTGEGAAGWGDLGEGVAGEGHDLSHISHGVGTSLGLSESIRGSSLGLEDGGVDLSLLVGSCTWDDGTLDTETGGVSTSITLDDGDLSVGGDERGSCKSNEEDLGEHLDGWGGSKRTRCKINIKIKDCMRLRINRKRLEELRKNR